MGMKKTKPPTESGAASITITLKRGTITVNHGDGPTLLRLTKVEPGAWEKIITTLMSIRAAKRTGPMKESIPEARGAMGLPLTAVGSVSQALAECAVDRGNVSHERMVEFLAEAPSKPKVLITCEGGCVQDVSANVDMDVYIIDHDNFEVGDRSEFAFSLEAAKKPDKPNSICDIDEAVSAGLAEYQQRFEAWEEEDEE